MIINERETHLNFLHDNTSSLLPNSLLQNPVQYRAFKRDINRINNIENEINFLKSQKVSELIDFVSLIEITESEYTDAVESSKRLIEKLDEEEISDIISHKKLLSSQKKILEIYFYLLGYECFDWSILREKFTLYEAKTRMQKVDYNKLQKRKVNFFLNRIYKTGGKNFIHIECDSRGMDLIYEWVRHQLKIYIYLTKKGLIQTTTRTSKPGRTENHFAYKIKQNKSNIYKPIKLRLTNYKETSNNQKEDDSVRIYPKMNTSHYTNFNNFDSNTFITNEMFIQQPAVSPSSMAKRNASVQERKLRVNDTSLGMKYDINDEKMLREEKVLQFLPMLQFKTFHQLRQYYEMCGKYDKRVERRHYNELQIIHPNKISAKDKSKVINMLAKKKIKILDNIPYYKLKEILS